MNVEIGTEAEQFIFWEYLFRIFGIVSLQCGMDTNYVDFLFLVILIQTLINGLLMRPTLMRLILSHLYLRRLIPDSYFVVAPTYITKYISITIDQGNERYGNN
jgi:hypothetical protein